MKWIALVLVCFSWRPAYAACEFFAELLARQERPTLAEVVRKIRAEPGCEKVLFEEVVTSPLDVRRAGSPLRDSIAKHGPEMIAFFEALYPNGTYATLGRDSFMIGDLIEAFYLAQGLESPVVRLGASGPTVQQMWHDNKLFAFLQSNGLDADRIAKGETPFVIIDRTPYHLSSQSRRLLRSVIASTEDPAIRREMKLSLNVASTETGWAEWSRGHTPGTAVRALRIAQMEDMFVTMNTLTDPLAVNTPDMGKILVDRPEVIWHNTHAAETMTLPDGRMLGIPGLPMPMHDRWTTLRLYWDLFLFVSGNDFWARVAEHYEHFTGNLGGRLFWDKNAPEVHAELARKRIVLGRDYRQQIIAGRTEGLSLNHRRLVAEQWYEREKVFASLARFDLRKQILKWRNLRKELLPRTTFGAALLEFSFNLKPETAEVNAGRFVDFVRTWFVGEDLTFEDLRMIEDSIQLSIRRRVLFQSAAPRILAGIHSRCRDLLIPKPPVSPYWPVEGIF